MRKVLLVSAAVTAAWFTVSAPAKTAHQSNGPELFGIGVFTTGEWDFFVAFTPDQQTAYFCRANGSFTYFTILQSRYQNDQWSAPEIAPFSGRWSDADPHISADGNKLFFISNRPDSGDAAREDYDIFVAERTASGWTEPRRLPAPINDGNTEWSPSVSTNGNLYFGSARPGGKGGNDLYIARWNGSGYDQPENLGDSINTPRGEVEPWIAPDESYMIFSGQNRLDGMGGFDLYSAQRINGVWQKPRLLPAPINSTAGDFNQSVSPDGKWLYFSSTRSVFDRMPSARLSYGEMMRRLASPGNGLGDIYRVPMSEVLRK